MIFLLPLSVSARMIGDMQPRSIREVRESAKQIPSNTEGMKKKIQSAVEELNKKDMKRDKFCDKGFCITLAKSWIYPHLERSFDTSNKRVIMSRREDKDGNRASVAFTEFIIKKKALPKDMMQFAMTLFTPNADEIALSDPEKVKAGIFDAYVSDYGNDQTDRGRLVIVLTNPKKKLGHILLFRAYPATFFEKMEGEFGLIQSSFKPL